VPAAVQAPMMAFQPIASCLWPGNTYAASLLPVIERLRQALGCWRDPSPGPADAAGLENLSRKAYIQAGFKFLR
jgi:hypothetical protein